MKTTKGVIDRLQAYFLEQDPAVIARLLANTMTDVHRFVCFDTLSEDEAHRLIVRSIHNSKQLDNFAKGKDNEPFKVSEGLPGEEE